MPDAARVHGHGSPPLLKRQAKGFNLELRHTAAIAPIDQRCLLKA